MINFGFGDFLGRVGEGAANLGESIGEGASQGLAGGGNYALDIMKAYDQGQRDYVETQGALQKQKKIDFDMINEMEEAKHKPFQRAIGNLSLMQKANVAAPVPTSKDYDAAITKILGAGQHDSKKLQEKAGEIREAAEQIARSQISYDPFNPMNFIKSVQENNIPIVSDYQAKIDEYQAQMQAKERIELLKAQAAAEALERRFAQADKHLDKTLTSAEERAKAQIESSEKRQDKALGTQTYLTLSGINAANQRAEDTNNRITSENDKTRTHQEKLKWEAQADKAASALISKYGSAAGTNRISIKKKIAAELKNVLQTGEPLAIARVKATFGSILNDPSVAADLGSGRAIIKAPNAGAMKGVAAPKARAQGAVQISSPREAANYPDGQTFVIQGKIYRKQGGKLVKGK